MPLGSRQHAARLAIRLAEVPVGGARDQTIDRVTCLHLVEHRTKRFRRKREDVSERRQRAPVLRLAGKHMQEQSRDQCLCLIVPMGVARKSRFVEYQRIGKCGDVFGNIDAFRIKSVHRIEGHRRPVGDTERIEDVHRPEVLPRTTCALGILSLGIDADNRSIPSGGLE